jgi:hypothetical protein
MEGTMKNWRAASKDSVIPGLLSGAAVVVTAAALGRRDSGSAAAPINATSHIVAGEQAADIEQLTLRNTGTGLALGVASTVFWAAVYQKLFGHAAERRGAPGALAAGAATAAIAYVTDYHVVPKRLTPGYEKRLSGKSLLTVYGALALGLAGGALLQRKRVARTGWVSRTDGESFRPPDATKG